MERVLLVSPFFFPDPIATGRWNTTIARHLCKRVRLTVFCLFPFYPRWKMERTPDTVDGIETRRPSRLIRFPANPTLRRAVLELQFFASTLIEMVTEKHRYDRVVAICPPSLFITALVRLRGARCVLVVHDLQSVYVSTDKGLAARVIVNVIKTIERSAFRKADQLIFLSREMLDRAARDYGIEKEKCSVAYPFVTETSFVDNGMLDDVIPLEEGVTNIVYSGGLGQKQNAEGLAELLLAMVEENPSCRAYIFSSGPVFEKIRTSYEGPAFRFRALVEESDLPELLARSTVQIVPQATGTSDGALPSKLPNLIASPAKVLVITDPGSELSRCVAGIDGVRVSYSWNLSTNLFHLQELTKPHCSQGRSREELLRLFSADHTVASILEKDVWFGQGKVAGSSSIERK